MLWIHLNFSLIQISNDGYLNWFQPLPIVKNAVVAMGLHSHICSNPFLSTLVYIPIKEIAPLSGNSVFRVFFFFVCVISTCMCVHIHMCEHMDVWICVHMCVKVRGQPWNCSSGAVSLIFEN